MNRDIVAENYSSVFPEQHRAGCTIQRQAVSFLYEFEYRAQIKGINNIIQYIIHATLVLSVACA